MTTPPAPAESDLSPRRWLRLARNELREILRDRRTILTLVLMPLLLYPLLGIGSHFAFGRGSQPADAAPHYRIGVESDQEGKRFQYLMQQGDRSWRRLTRGDTDADDSADATPNITLYGDSELDERLRWGELDLVVRVRAADRGRSLTYEIAYDPESSSAREALHYVQGRLLAANLPAAEERLIHPLRSHPKAMARAEHRRGFLLAVLVPLVLILMTMTGAVYPAIDLTAGERERGTLEMLMATPVSRLGLLAAKYAAVLTVAVLTALVNLVMMALTFLAFGGWLYAPGTLGVSLGTIPLVLFLVVLFAAFYSAVLLALASFARSFKEAQAYIVPLTLVSLVPGLLSLVPNLQLGYGLALVPLLNIVLLARDLLSGMAEGGTALVVIVATVVYGYVALVLASRAFGAEAVLYSDGRSWFDLFRRRG